NLPANSVGHFRLLFYSAVLVITDYLHRFNEFAGESRLVAPGPFPFLEGYAAELHACLPEEIEGPHALQWWREQVELWERGTTSWLPLRALAHQLKLTHEELMVLMLAGMVEED